MSEWKPINLMDVVGMASNPVNPGTKFAKRLLNVYTHEKPGALTLRPGYAPKYTPPSNTTITNSSFINFGVFFDRQADSEGEEIICEIQKGTVVGLNNGGTPIVADTMNGFWFWTRPYWTGSAWVDSWDWINKTIITKITAVDATYLSHLEIFGNAAHGLGNDSLVGWTIYNKTKNQFAKIITCKLNSPDLTINITYYENSWEVDDVLIISKCWIDIDAQTEFYNNVTKEDIVYHRINHDLRIGFGGLANRPGLMIGYRKKYLKILEVDFTSLHADISEAGALEKFAKTDGIILDTHILSGSYGVNLTLVADISTPIPAGTYYFRLTGIGDDYIEQWIAETNIVVPAGQSIAPLPYVELGKNSIRLTDMNLYISTDNITFRLIRRYTLTSDSFIPQEWEINEQGKYIQASTNNDLYVEIDAGTIGAGDTNNVSNWDMFYSGPLYGWTVVATTNGGSPSTNVLLCDNSPIATNTNDEVRGCSIPIAGLKVNTLYTVSFYAKRYNSNASNLRIVLTDNTNNISIRSVAHALITDAWVQYTVILSTGTTEVLATKLAFGLWTTPAVGVCGFYLDDISILEILKGDLNETYTDELSSEMPLEMGYTPTYNLVRGWDQALDGGNGRIYYLNPYIEKRYENYLVVSHIHSNGSFMRDIASFSNFRELEKYDSNETKAIELLPNKQILILKDSSVTSLADDGLVGFMREPIYGFDCVSRNSVVNIGGLIFFCGKEEIYLINIGSSLIPKPLLENTIRDLYLAITDKTKILGTRNRFNTYRIRVNDQAQKLEYLLSEKGWVEERKWHFPEIYRIGFNNKLYFLSNGTIYEETVDFTLTELEYGEIGVE